MQAAAKTYFSKPVWKLRLEQSALLAGLPQAPSEDNPFLNPAGARERRNEVLKKMADLGYIKAMASSCDYKHNQYNLAAQGHRQPGSAFKTFVLTTAIKRGVDPYSTFYTSKPLELDTTEWGHWSVVTYGETYSGTMDIAAATLASDNTVYAQLDLDLGPD